MTIGSPVSGPRFRRMSAAMRMADRLRSAHLMGSNRRELGSGEVIVSLEKKRDRSGFEKIVIRNTSISILNNIFLHTDSTWFNKFFTDSYVPQHMAAPGILRAARGRRPLYKPRRPSSACMSLTEEKKSVYRGGEGRAAAARLGQLGGGSLQKQSCV